MYGKDGAFLMLSNECFTRTADKYEYVVCPFSEVRQKDGQNDKVSLKPGFKPKFIYYSNLAND